eukprot:12407914-Karenia_brevis.AAC.1
MAPAKISRSEAFASRGVADDRSKAVVRSRSTPRSIPLISERLAAAAFHIARRVASRAIWAQAD